MVKLGRVREVSLAVGLSAIQGILPQSLTQNTYICSMRFIVAFIGILTCFKSYTQTKPNIVLLDEYITSSCYVEATNKNKSLWTGTGFFVEVDHTRYFITNDHVVGGIYYINQHKRDFKTPPPKDSFPDALFVSFYDKQFGKFNHKEVSILKNGEPNYVKFYEIENNENTLMDVVAIDVSFIDSSLLVGTYIFKEKDFCSNLSLNPSNELFVVGFPKGYGGSNNYPIWKRATIASEPKIGSWFWIDATARGGMSGSPVLFRNHTYYTTGGEFTMGKEFTFLIGIYNSQDYDTEVGRVFKIDFIFNKLKSITNGIGR